MTRPSIISALIFSILSLITLPIKADECLSMHIIQNSYAGYIDDNGEVAGIHWDFLSALEEESGLCMDKEILPYARAWRGIQLGNHDGGILSKATERDRFVEYIAKLVTLKTVVIPRNGLTLYNYDDLQNILIGRVRGTLLSDRFDNDPELTVTEIIDYERAIKMLEKGRFDAIAGSALGLRIMTKLEQDQYFNFPGRLVISERELWLQLSKNSPQIGKVPQLRQATEALVKKGVFNNLLKKYYGENWNLSN